VAVNLAAGLLNRTKSEVIVAELLPGQGALALDLGLTTSKGLIDLLSLSKVVDITRDNTREALIHHGSGLKLLLSSDRPRDMQLINQTAHYEAILSALASLARFVILDLGVGIQPFAHKILPHCNDLLIVLEGSPNIIAHTRALIDDITSMNVNRRNINTVLNNRIRSDTQLPTTQVQSKLDFEILSTLSPAPELFTQATRMQAPAVLCQPESLTTRQVQKLVEFIAEREALPR
jgi:Flp pilus assembly CpaE family ATPase